jgi:lipopolysaccharide transport system permease protein
MSGSAAALRPARTNFFDLVGVLTSKELKLRYRGTSLGVLWSLANPVCFAVVLHFAMRVVMKLDIENYGLFLLSTLFAWQWASNSLNASSSAFTMNGRLIRKLAFPRYLLCAAVVAADLFHFLVTIPVYAGMRVFYGLPPGEFLWLWGVPLLIVIQGALVLGGVLLIATLNSIVRDVEQLVRVGLLLLFYVTPILFPLSMVPERLHWVVLVNPFAPLLISWRELLADGTMSSYVAWAAAHAAIALAAGFAVYRRFAWRLPEVV